MNYLFDFPDFVNNVIRENKIRLPLSSQADPGSLHIDNCCSNNILLSVIPYEKS